MIDKVIEDVEPLNTFPQSGIGNDDINSVHSDDIDDDKENDPPDLPPPVNFLTPHNYSHSPYPHSYESTFTRSSFPHPPVQLSNIYGNNTSTWVPPPYTGYSTPSHNSPQPRFPNTSHNSLQQGFPNLSPNTIQQGVHSPPCNVPSCLPIKGRRKNDKQANLPSTEINKDQLVHQELVLSKYQSLVKESTVGTLAVKLANESFFGNDILRKCTVMGCRDYPALPLAELSKLYLHCFPSTGTITQTLKRKYGTPALTLLDSFVNGFVKEIQLK